MNYTRTVRTCYLSTVTQSLIVNLPPLLFTLLARGYGLNLERLGRLVLINFVTQLAVDAIAARLADKIGYRRCLVAAHLLAALGFALYGLFPPLLPGDMLYGGLCFATVVFSIGGGLIEVLVSPIVNQISGRLGAGAMTLLHSFYCWGQMLTVLLTTILLRLLPGPLWHVVPLLWTVIPLATTYGFATSPMAEPGMGDTPPLPLSRLMRSGTFWLAVGLMAFSGASEVAMAQWASLFAEQGIGVSKLTGDLLGPCLFAVFMALVRMLYGKFESKIPLERFLRWGAAACAVCYVTAALSKSPALALAACALTGATVALMWPGILHRSAGRFPGGGTGLFGMLALGGDLGCSLGPWLLGFIGDRAGLRPALLAGAVFPAGFLALTLAGRRRENQNS
ncbi:MAG: MFS transporter [Oscillospiraceae bacterium]|jgi:fucose permease|nr:MFS transporter [Oscillospiraceae bacterium]